MGWRWLAIRWDSKTVEQLYQKLYLFRCSMVSQYQGRIKIPDSLSFFKPDISSGPEAAP